MPRALGWCSWVALALAACTPGPLAKPRAEGPASPEAKASPLGASPRPGPQPSGPVVSPKGEAAQAPSLPARMGLAWPASMVGSEALSRQGAKAFAPFGHVMAIEAGGRIASLPEASLLANHGAGLISNHGGGLISNHGGGVGPAPAAARRLLEELPFRIDARHHLWLVNAIVDLKDQLQQAYLQAGPKVGEWRRFQAPELSFLPPPTSHPLIPVALAALAKVEAQRHYAGLLTLEAGRPRLRVLVLPEEGASLAQGLPLLDHQSMGPGHSVLRARSMAGLREAFALEQANLRVERRLTEEGLRFRLDLGTRHAPEEQRTALGKLASGPGDGLTDRFRITIDPSASASALVRLEVAQRFGQPSGAQRYLRALHLMAFALPPLPDPGLVVLSRKAEGPVGSPAAFVWHRNLGGELPLSAPPPYQHLLPEGEASGPPSAALVALQPVPGPLAEGDLPPLPEEGYRPEEEASLTPEPLASELWALPEGP
jgi:hypothetical protein